MRTHLKEWKQEDTLLAAVSSHCLSQVFQERFRARGWHHVNVWQEGEGSPAALLGHITHQVEGVPRHWRRRHLGRGKSSPLLPLQVHHVLRDLL